MKLISRIILSIILMLASGPGHAVPLLTLDASGQDGRQATPGRDHSGTQAAEGSNGSVFPDANANGATASNGQNGGLIDVTATSPVSGTVLITGTVNSPQNGNSSPNTSVTYANTSAVILLDASGGNAAPGGIGGGGQMGGKGYDGDDAEAPNKEATPGEKGARGGQGGNGTPATQAGNSGNINLRFKKADAHLAMLFQANVSGGAYGPAGVNGAGGPGGQGGTGGNGVNWTEQGQVGSNQEEMNVLDANGQPIPKTETVMVDDYEDQVQGQKPADDGSLDADGNPIMVDNVVRVQVGSHPEQQPVLDANNQPVYETTVVDVPVMGQIPMSLPEAGNGPQGDPGNPGVGNITGSRAGNVGNFTMFVTNPDGTISQFKSRYNLVVTGYTLAAGSNNGIFQPGDNVVVSGIRVKNMSPDMPSPAGQNALMTIDDAGWIVSGTQSLTIPTEIQPLQEITIPGNFNLAIRDTQITQGMSTTATVYPDIMLQGVNRHFEALGTLQQSFTVAYPVTIKMTSPDLSKMDPKGVATITYQITNSGRRAIGAQADLARAVQLVIRSAGGQTLDPSQIIIYDSNGRPVPAGQSVITDIPSIAAGQTITMQTKISIGANAPRNTNGQIIAELHIQSPATPATTHIADMAFTPVAIEGMISGIFHKLNPFQQQQTRPRIDPAVVAMQASQQRAATSRKPVGPIYTCEEWIQAN